MLRFLVDESLPRAVTRVLVGAGHDVPDGRDGGLRGAPDTAVMARAIAEGRFLVSADLDFSNVLAFPPGSHPGIAVLRVPDEWSPLRRAERVLSGLLDAGIENLPGAIVIIEPARVRLLAQKAC